MTVSMVKLPTATSAANPKGLPSGGLGKRSSTMGILGICGMLLEFKHGIPAIYAPFAKCTCFWDIIWTLGQMEDGVFIGVVMWTVMLAASGIAIGAAIMPVIGLAISLVTRKSSPRSVGEE